MAQTNKKLKIGRIFSIKNFRPSRKTYFIILIIGLALIAFYNKKWFVAATVNGTPISNFELLAKLNDQFRSQTLNQMINEKIILDEAKRKNLKITSDEINEKIAQLEKNVGGTEVLNSLLSQQGQTRESLRDQLRIQLLIEKLYASEATSSTKEINDFMTGNKYQLQSTTAAEQAKEAEEILKQQKLAKVFSEKFQQLKQQAKISIF